MMGTSTPEQDASAIFIEKNSSSNATNTTMTSHEEKKRKVSTLVEEPSGKRQRVSKKYGVGGKTTQGKKRKASSILERPDSMLKQARKENGDEESAAAEIHGSNTNVGTMTSENNEDGSSLQTGVTNNDEADTESHSQAYVFEQLDNISESTALEWFNHDFKSIASEYTKGKMLGQGAYGFVIKTRSLKDGQVYALKWIWKDQEDSSYDQKAEVENETAFLKRFQDNPGVVGFHELIEATHGTFLVLDYCEGSNLDFCFFDRKCLTEATGRAIAAQLLTTVKNIHAQKVVHRDIKPSNLRCDFNPDGSVVSVKLLDLGGCLALGKDVVPSFYGTGGFLAPEICKGGSSYYTAGETDKDKVDMFSIGRTIYLILRGRPWPGGLSDDYTTWGDLDFWTRDFIEKLLEREPCNRMSAAEALEHPFVVGESFADIRKALPWRVAFFCREHAQIVAVFTVFCLYTALLASWHCC